MIFLGSQITVYLCFVEVYNRTTLERERERMKLQAETNGRFLPPIGSRNRAGRELGGLSRVRGVSDAICELDGFRLSWDVSWGRQGVEMDRLSY